MANAARNKTAQRRQRLLALLSDGELHSGAALASKLRISRAAIWKLIESLRALGVEIESVAREGYKLPFPVDVLDRAAILGALSPPAKERLARLDVLLTVDSTNQFVADAPSPEPGLAQVCIAELQTAGRGRRGRSWSAPFGSGVCMSLGWQFSDPPPTFSALSLAVGVVVVRTLRSFGAEEIGLKWPNDIMWRGRKLGGVLIEMRGESAGPAHVVIGIGLNVRMPRDVRLMLAEKHAALVADLHEVLRERRPARNLLVAVLTTEVTAMLGVFARHGFAAFLDEWRSLDALADAEVKVINGAKTLYGAARGVDADGCLLVEIEGVVQKFISGEVSLRAAR